MLLVETSCNYQEGPESNQSPTLRVSADPVSGEAPLQVKFTAIATDAEGDSLSYSWNFGDSSQQSTLQNPTHTYAEAGTYTAACTVTDKGSPPQTAVDTVTITVSEDTSITKMSLWQEKTKLRGANIYQRRVYVELDGSTFMGSGVVGPPYTREDFDELAALGANYVNISHPGLYTENSPYSLDTDIQANLDNLLAKIALADMFAVISFRTGPGRSEFTFFWGEDDDWFDKSYYNDRVWKNQQAQEAWAEMWKYTARRYQGHAVVVGYDLMVEPNSNEVWLDIWEPRTFYNRHADTLYDWNPLQAKITAAIREVDSATPVLIQGMSYSSVEWFPYIIPGGDSNTVYLAHQYAPIIYTHQEGTKYQYPDYLDTNWDGNKEQFNKTWLDNLLKILDQFINKYQVAVAVNEFGLVRWAPNSADFMDDQMALFEQRNFNHALWAWNCSWTEYEVEVDAFDFMHGSSKSNHKDVPGNPLLAVIKKYWAKNQLRPSNTTFKNSPAARLKSK